MLESGDRRQGGEPRMMALGVVFHGAQLALDLAVAGMSLAVALTFFALVTTVLWAELKADGVEHGEADGTELKADGAA